MIFSYIKRSLMLLTQKKTPRWLVLFTDVFLVTFAYAMATIAFDYSDAGQLAWWRVLIGLGITIVAYMLTALATHSYAFVITLSMINDLVRLFIAHIAMLAFLCVVNAIIGWAVGYVIISYWVYFFTCSVSFALIIAERVIIKQVYNDYWLENTNRKNVLVYGVSVNSLLVASSLKTEARGCYNPVALAAEGVGGKRKVNQMPVVNITEESLKQAKEEFDIAGIVVPDEYVFDISDQLLTITHKLDLKLMTINHVSILTGKDNNDKHDSKSDSAPQISKMVGEVKIEDLLGREPIRHNRRDVREFISGRVVMITGACGSIGSEIARQAAHYGAQKLVLVDQAETPMHDLMLELNKSFPNIEKEYFIADVQNAARIEQAFKSFKPSLVLHAAAYKHVPMMEINPTEGILTNVGGTRIVADLAVKYDVEKFVMISTDKAVNPTNVMGATKRLAEIYTQSLSRKLELEGKHTKFITTRFGNVLGSNGSVIPLFRKQIEAGGPVTVTHRDIIRYFMTIPEACSLVLKASCIGMGRHLYIFDMGKPVKILTLAERMIQLSGMRPYEDIDIVEVGLRPGEKLYEELLNTRENTIPTGHEKIFIAKATEYDYNDALRAVEACVAAAAEGDEYTAVKVIKEFVVEYRSRNSRFCAIDDELGKA